MPIKESILNEAGIFIQERICPLLGEPYTQDYVVINGREYITSYALWNEKLITVWGENDEPLKYDEIIELLN